MHIDEKDTILLGYIRENPGNGVRRYANRFWNEVGSLSRSGAVFRLERLKAHGFISVSEIHPRLMAVDLTDQGRDILTGVQV